jgi:hypothetical protein
LDFPVNRFFQPILEFRSTHYVGGRTPNAFENNPLDGLAGARVYPTRWMSIGGAYRHHFNQQDRDYFGDNAFRGTTTIPGGTTITNNFTGTPPGFTPSSDPHGFIFQITAGRRNARTPVRPINQFANVTDLVLSETTVAAPCPPGFRPRPGANCPDVMTTNVATTAVDPEGDVLTYNYTVSGGRIVGQGANVSWDLTGAAPGTYTITAGVDDGCGICGTTQTRTITVVACDCVEVCVCPTVSVTGPAGLTTPGDTMTFTANVTGGTTDRVTYDWSVNNGTIIEGQGTPVIRVATSQDMAGQNVTATVRIGGVCEECPREASDTGSLQERLEATEIDNFGVLPNDEVRARIDNLFISLQNNPNAQGYIINYGSARDVARRETLIRNHIRLRNYDESRITFIRGGTGPLRTTLWVVPQGATPPTPDF